MTHFIYNNLSSLFTVTATSSLSNFPVSNVVTRDINRVWRATKAANVYITFTGGTSTYSFDSVFLCNTNLSVIPGANESVQFQVSTDGTNWTGYNLNRRSVSRLKFSDGRVTIETQTILYYIASSTITYKHFRILINQGTSHPYSYYQVGEVFCFASDCTLTAGGFQKDFEFGNSIEGTTVVNQFGTEFPVSRYIQKKGTFDFVVTNTELTCIEKICYYPNAVFFPLGQGTDVSNPNDFYIGSFSLLSVATNGIQAGGGYMDKRVRVKFTEV